MRKFDAVRLFILVPVIATMSAEAQHKSARSAKADVRENYTESLWTREYANRDYGFYVLLPEGYVGHGSHSPNPNHGFLIGLPDPSTTGSVTLDDKRFVWVIAEYNPSDLNSLNEVADWRIKISGKGKSNFTVLSSSDTKLNGLPAKHLRYEYGSANAKVIQEKVIALRGNILYEIGLTTTADDYKKDEEQFLKMLNNFRRWRIH